MSHGPLRVGIGGPVGSGKTTLAEKLCKALASKVRQAAGIRRGAVGKP